MDAILEMISVEVKICLAGRAALALPAGNHADGGHHPRDPSPPEGCPGREADFLVGLPQEPNRAATASPLRAQGFRQDLHRRLRARHRVPDLGLAVVLPRGNAGRGRGLRYRAVFSDSRPGHAHRAHAPP